MKSFLLKVPWIGLLGLLVLSAPAWAQETEHKEPEEKSFWEGLRDKSKSVVGATGHQVSEGARKVLTETRDKYVPILREAGYEVSEIRLAFSLAPTVTLRAVHVKRIDDSQRAALLHKYEDDRSATAVLETIFAAEKVEVEGLEVKELHLTLGLQLRATVVLSPTDAGTG